MKTTWNKPKKENRLSKDELNQYRHWLSITYPICQLCNLNATQEFHHLIYGSYGADKNDKTLVATCRKCHEWCHKNKHESQKKYYNIAKNNWLAYNE